MSRLYKRTWVFLIALVALVVALYISPVQVAIAPLRASVFVWSQYIRYTDPERYSDPDRPSFASQLFVKVAGLAPGYEASEKKLVIADVPKLRKAMEDTLRLFPSPSDVEHEHWNYNGVPCMTAVPKGLEHPNRGPIFLYLHGGGFVEGSISSHAAFVSALASRLNMAGVIVDYRLAPEHHLPAAVDDAEKIYKFVSDLRNQIARPRGKATLPGQGVRDVIVMGDSAGGALSFQLAQRILTPSTEDHECDHDHDHDHDHGHVIHSHGDPTYALEKKAAELKRAFRAIVAISPWTDLTNSQPAHVRNNGRDPVLRSEFVQFCSSVMVSEPKHENLKSLSPLFFSDDYFQALPPTFVVVGDLDVLEDDARLIVEKAHEAGSARAEIKVYKGQFHDFPIFSALNFLPEAEESMADIVRFVQSVLV